MPTITSGRLALAMSSLALVVAIGGAGYAAATIGTAQLKKNAVTSPKVKKDTLTGKDVNESKLAKVPAAATADNAAKVDGMSAARVTYQSGSNSPEVVFTGGGLTITVACDTLLDDLTVTASTASPAWIYSYLVDTDSDAVVAEDLENRAFDSTYNLLASATPDQEDPGVVTFVYTAADGTMVTGDLAVDAHDVSDTCTVRGTILFG
jgi:hypothetical protein